MVRAPGTSKISSLAGTTLTSPIRARPRPVPLVPPWPLPMWHPPWSIPRCKFGRSAPQTLPSTAWTDSGFPSVARGASMNAITARCREWTRRRPPRSTARTRSSNGVVPMTSRRPSSNSMILVTLDSTSATPHFQPMSCLPRNASPMSSTACFPTGTTASSPICVPVIPFLLSLTETVFGRSSNISMPSATPISPM